MGAVETTYTFAATDTITSAKMNNIIDETTMTGDAVLGGSGGIGGLDIASGKLSISPNAINSSRLATDSVTTNAITNGSVTPVKLSTYAPTWSNGVTTVQPALELGGGITTNQSSYVDFHAVPGTDYESRIIRGAGTNGNLAIENTGTGLFSIAHYGAGAVTLQTSSQERMRITATGNVGVGTASPSYSFDVAGSGFPLARVSSTFSNGSGIYSSLVFGTWSGANTGANIGFVQNSSTPSQSFYHITPWGGTEGFNFKVSSSGRVGVSVSGEPSSTLQVGGTVTATAFSGPLTGNVTGNVTGSASTVSNSAITAAKLDGNQSGSAPIFGARAWVNFNGQANTDIAGTYARTSSTTVTITATAHGFIAGNSVYLDFTVGTGTAPFDGLYLVNSVTDANTFTVISSTTTTSTGTATLKRKTIRGSGNVSNVSAAYSGANPASPPAANQIIDNGYYVLNFATAMPDANFAISGSCNENGALAATSGNDIINGFGYNEKCSFITTINITGVAIDCLHNSVQVIR